MGCVWGDAVHVSAVRPGVCVGGGGWVGGWMVGWEGRWVVVGVYTTYQYLCNYTCRGSGHDQPSLP